MATAASDSEKTVSDVEMNDVSEEGEPPDDDVQVNPAAEDVHRCCRVHLILVVGRYYNTGGYRWTRELARRQDSEEVTSCSSACIRLSVLCVGLQTSTSVTLCLQRCGGNSRNHPFPPLAAARGSSAMLLGIQRRQHLLMCSHFADAVP